eukprot:6479340-Prymnesium_polylepis.1
MVMELARREVGALDRQADADARLDELCARLRAGDTRAWQMQQEIDALEEELQVGAEEEASKHALVDWRAAGSPPPAASPRAPPRRALR